MDKYKHNSDTLRVIDIVYGTIVDGPGLRTSIYFAGCRHQCPGCHNPTTWDFDAGADMGIDEIVDHVVESDMDVTLTGGDPLFQIESILKLCKQIHSVGKTIWCYTGYTYEQILADPKLRPILSAVDVIVDGRYMQQLRDTTLRFRGSSNQRIIDLHKTLEGQISIWQPENWGI